MDFRNFPVCAIPLMWFGGVLSVVLRRLLNSHGVEGFAIAPRIEEMRSGPMSSSKVLVWWLWELKSLKHSFEHIELSIPAWFNVQCLEAGLNIVGVADWARGARRRWEDLRHATGAHFTSVPARIVPREGKIFGLDLFGDWIATSILDRDVSNKKKRRRRWVSLWLFYLPVPI